jgi:3-hydroxyisobutyryl-CoA hydrolase
VESNWDFPGRSADGEQIASISFFQNADIVPDFAEGVTHLLVNKRKDRAAWNPPSLEATPDEQIRDIFFNPKRKYTQLTRPEPHMVDYKEYPHSNFGLPAEEKVVSIAKEKDWNVDEVLKAVKGKYAGKPGLEEHVKEILERRQK